MKPFEKNPNLPPFYKPRIFTATIPKRTTVVTDYIPHSRRNEFRSKLQVSPLPDGVRWQLDKDLSYVDDDGAVITVPKGFVTDFASIPPLATLGALAQLLLIGGRVSLCGLLAGRWLFGWYCALAFAWLVVFLANGLEHEGTWDEASALHDWLYATRCRGFFKSNWILYRAMVAKGGGVTVFWKRFVIWQAVNLGGYLAWIDDQSRSARTGPNRCKKTSPGATAD